MSGLELSEPFSGAIRFNQVSVTGTLPNSSSTSLSQHKSHTFTVTVNNTGVSPESFFVDARLPSTETVSLLDQNASGPATDMSLPLPAGLSFPYYFVPTDTTQLQASIAGSVPVSFDMEYFPGDPDVSPAVKTSGTSGSSKGDKASVTFSEAEVSPGFWTMNPDEIGPYGSSGAPAATASEAMKAVTRAFDPTVASSTGDMWSFFNGLSSSFAPVYVPSGDSATITIAITPTAKVGAKVSGTLFVDDYTIASFVTGTDLPNGDQLAAIPYSYTVSK